MLVLWLTCDNLTILYQATFLKFYHLFIYLFIWMDTFVQECMFFMYELGLLVQHSISGSTNQNVYCLYNRDFSWWILAVKFCQILCVFLFLLCLQRWADRLGGAFHSPDVDICAPAAGWQSAPADKPETHQAIRWQYEVFGETWTSSGTNLSGVYSCAGSIWNRADSLLRFNLWSLKSFADGCLSHWILWSGVC